MLVLDSLRKVEKSQIKIPPFHTGHLGFVPGSMVYVGFLTRRDKGASPCELIVTPYPQSKNDLSTLDCTLHDEPGVVKRVIEVVSKFNINIVLQESFSVDHLVHHRVSLVLDWSQSDRPFAERKPSTRRIKSIYNRYSPVVPLSELRFVELFEAVAANCLKSLHFEATGDGLLPALKIRAINLPNTQETAPTEIESYKKTVLVRDVAGQCVEEERPGLTKCFTIPGTILGQIRSSLRLGDDAPLYYVIASDTDSRMLRVLFADEKRLNSLLHVGLQHKNRPGALDSILRSVEDARFNIWTSLLRQGNIGENIWEALVESKSPEGEARAQPAPFSDVCAVSYPSMDEAQGKALLEQLKARLLKGADSAEKGLLHRFQVQLQYPKYPKYPALEGLTEPINGSAFVAGDADDEADGQKSDGASGAAGPDDIADLVTRRLREQEREINGPVNGTERRKLFDAIRERVGATQPVVGVWHSSGGLEHARLLMDKLAEAQFLVEDLGESVSRLAHKDPRSHWDLVIGLLVPSASDAAANATFFLSVGAVAAKRIPSILLVRGDLQQGEFSALSDFGIETFRFSDLQYVKSTISNVVARCHSKLQDADD